MSRIGWAAFVLVACASTQGRPPAPAAGPVRYDARAGACPSLRPPEPRVLFANRDAATNTFAGVDAECVDFSGFEFQRHIGAAYPKLTRWNLRGAKLSKARFSFANIVDADLSGADLRELNFGYARIDGKGDEHTKLPPRSCQMEGDRLIRCFR